MQGLIAGFGTYTVDGEIVTIVWEASSYPNRTGTVEAHLQHRWRQDERCESDSLLGRDLVSGVGARQVTVTS